MSSLLLIILLLSLSIQACDGRHISSGINDLIISSYDLRKVVVEVKADKTSPPLKPLKKGSTVDVIPGSATVERPMASKAPSRVVVEGKKEAVSGAVRISSLVKVSWSLPRQNHSKYPGFHVDYVGPRTHPPAHN